MLYDLDIIHGKNMFLQCLGNTGRLEYYTLACSVLGASNNLSKFSSVHRLP